MKLTNLVVLATGILSRLGKRLLDPVRGIQDKAFSISE
jgi:hypothetical protein